MQVEKLCRPYGTRINFPLHPALRLRLRAGLNRAAPTALDPWHLWILSSSLQRVLARVVILRTDLTSTRLLTAYH